MNLTQYIESLHQKHPDVDIWEVGALWNALTDEEKVVWDKIEGEVTV